MRYRLKLLGPFALETAEAIPLPLASKKSQGLLAVLALAQGGGQTRDRLAALFWSDRDEEQARGSLRQALTALRRTFEAAPDLISIDGDRVALAEGLLDCDATALLEFNESGASEDLAAAADLYRGSLLEGLQIRDPAFEDWLFTERRRFQGLHMKTLTSLLAHQESVGDWTGLQRTAERLLRLDPAEETAHRALMRGYAAVGDRARALRQYQLCRDALERELGVAPSRETEKLQGEIEAGLTERTQNVQPTGTPSDGLSVAVLPFLNLSGDPDQDYFSDGITEDLITELSRFGDFLVIARNSCFTYKGRNVDVRQVGRELAVRYVVEGSVRKAGQRIRVAVQLIEAESGNHLWAERYDRDLEDVFAVQDEITRTIAGTLGGRLNVAGQQHAMRHRAENLAAYDLAMRGSAHYFRFTRQDSERARDYLRQAIEADPNYALAHSELSAVLLMDWMAFWTGDREATFEAALGYAKRAVQLDDGSCRARRQLGDTLWFNRQYGEARYQFEAARRINPNDAELLGIYGLFLSAVGEPEAGLELFQEAARIDPFDPSWRPWLLGITYFSARRYEEAIAALTLVQDPINEVRGWLAASYARVGRMAEAGRALESFLEHAEADMTNCPPRKLAAWEPFWRAAMEYRDPEDMAHLMESLKLAGLPE